jgi:cation diffusion facilitator family transporter
MLSEAVHSLVDTLNEVLLLYGLRRAGRRPDAGHPLGHGREIYFWSFVVALLVFALGAGVSIYEGIVHLRHPEPVEAPVVVYAVLALALVFESLSWWVAWKQFRAVNPDRSLLAAIRHSKDPTIFTVLMEDSAAVLGLLMALAATAAGQWFARPELDGIGSLAIGLLLAATALLLARETKGLLIGEPADAAVVDLILDVARRQPGVVSANGVLTTHVAPDQIVASVSLEFDDALRAPDIERAVAAIEEMVRAGAPAVVLLFVKPQTAGGYERARRRYFGLTAEA